MKKVFLKIVSTGERNPCARKSIRIDLSGYYFSDFKWWWRLKKRITGVGRGETKLGEFCSLNRQLLCQRCSPNLPIWGRGRKEKKHRTKTSIISFKYPDLHTPHSELFALSHRYLSCVNNELNHFLKRHFTFQALSSLAKTDDVCVLHLHKSPQLFNRPRDQSDQHTVHSSYCSLNW